MDAQIKLLDVQKLNRLRKKATDLGKEIDFDDLNLHLFEEDQSSNGELRVLITESPFYCSDDKACDAKAQINRVSYESEILKGGVSLIIS